jgi:hypothetical protein
MKTFTTISEAVRELCRSTSTEDVEQERLDAGEFDGEHASPALLSAPAPLELTPAVSAPDADRPTFVPLALAIDLGMTDPVGTIKTRSVLLGPSDTVSLGAASPAAATPKRRRRDSQSETSAPAVRGAGRGSRLIRGPWTARAIPPMDPPAARTPATPPPPGRPRLTLLPGLLE